MAQQKPTRPAKGTPAKAGAKPPVKRPPVRGRTIVNQKTTPWGLILTTVAIVLFAVAIVVVVIVTKKHPKADAGADVNQCTKMIGTNSTSYLNELQCAKDISGVAFYPTSNRTHVTTTVDYPQSPPVGGNHSPVWADCTGMVYATQLANENAVHSLEHGAIWITYNPTTISPADLTALQNRVQGQDRELLTPYAGLKTPISLQSWGYQLFVNSATDPRIDQFINDLRYNPKTTPEYPISCSDPGFNAAESTPGHPQTQ